MADKKLLALVREWCDAKAQYDHENFPGGYPFYTTAHRLYHAGRALYLVSGVEPAEGSYKLNKWFEHPTDHNQKILDANRKPVRNYGTDLPSGRSDGYYLGKDLIKKRRDNANRCTKSDNG